MNDPSRSPVTQGAYRNPTSGSIIVGNLWIKLPLVVLLVLCFANLAIQFENFSFLFISFK